VRENQDLQRRRYLERETMKGLTREEGEGQVLSWWHCPDLHLL